jgi:hypothetical protein
LPPQSFSFTSGPPARVSVSAGARFAPSYDSSSTSTWGVDGAGTLLWATSGTVAQMDGFELVVSSTPPLHSV